MWKFNWKTGKDMWIILLVVGVILLILAFPSGGKKSGGLSAQPTVQLEENLAVSAKASVSYEEQLEERVKEILKHVEGVGEVDVMIVLKSSEEKVYRVDKSTSSSITEEEDQNGGTRKVNNQELQENTILPGDSAAKQPVVEKELKPEIAGIIISAEGGASPTVKSEISAAMEALFDIPPHKIKVLKRVDQ